MCVYAVGIICPFILKEAHSLSAPTLILALATDGARLRRAPPPGPSCSSWA